MVKLPLTNRQSNVRDAWRRGIRKVSSLAKITGVPLSTVYKYVAKLKNKQTLNPLPRPGRPRILPPEKRHVLGRIIQNNRYLTCKEITTSLNLKPKILPRTINREINKLGYRTCHPRTVPMLTSEQCERRVEWALAHAKQNWKSVVFSDETTFQMFRNTIKAFYKVGTEIPQRGVPKHPAKVHVWGAFSARGTIGFHMFTQNMDGQLYREILTNHLFENASKIMPKQWVFQMDNDPKHKAKKTGEFLCCRSVRVLDWPSYSPDINPIENLWAIIKRRVEKKVNNVLRKKKVISTECWHEIIKKEWELISVDTCLHLVNGMTARLDEVIEKKGKKINH
jgi:transposase